MRVGCLADEHISSALVRALRNASVDVVTVPELGLASTDDTQVAQLALSQQRIVLTRDVDFLRLSAESCQQGGTFAPVAFWPQGTARTIGYLVSRIVPLANDPVYASICCQVFYL